MLTPYRPEPYVNFADPEPRRLMLDALQSVRSQLGRKYSILIGDQEIETVDRIESRMPADPGTLIGLIAKANVDQADDAIKRQRLLEARIQGRGRNGDPVCASVPLLGDGWRVAAN